MLNFNDDLISILREMHVTDEQLTELRTKINNLSAFQVAFLSTYNLTVPNIIALDRYSEAANIASYLIDHSKIINEFMSLATKTGKIQPKLPFLPENKRAAIFLIECMRHMLPHLEAERPQYAAPVARPTMFNVEHDPDMPDRPASCTPS